MVSVHVCRSFAHSCDHGYLNLCETSLDERSIHSTVNKCRQAGLLLIIIENKMQEIGGKLETSSTQTANKLLTFKPILTTAVHELQQCNPTE
jgi:hypothetical protein